ncbi:peptidoglycan-binding domain-containing protein [Algibacter pectinivorans]|uniref:Putative peptidoglycan binding domain-containing protein n=1 Tax=Algibacter pectinivorans TaxID=870482 RepID=A0A1I1NIM8_9FLAO|nr:peptidoglycan-binding domain-containing protein [Algibacter pectinivorans]SFC97335.1 Putative peptidoglycan binding domain-containing protein [Algibacter pectinivorans]
MKQIIIFLLVIIVLAIGYNIYKEHKRFTPPEYEYVTNKNIDLNYHDRSFLLNYYKAVEDLNGHVITQWSANGIDVRNSDSDDEEELAAISKYTDKLGAVKFYEDQLVKSKTLKDSGLTNANIKLLETKGISIAEFEKEKVQSKLIALFNDNISELRVGQKSVFVYELQKLLVKNGFDIPVDGLYKTITRDAILSFEEKNGLFPDGKVDLLTFEALLK